MVKTIYYKSSQVIKILRISRVTLYKWIMLGKIKPVRRVKGNKLIVLYPEGELDRVSKLLVERRRKGKSLFREEE